MVVLCSIADEGRHEVLPSGIGVGMTKYRTKPRYMEAKTVVLQEHWMTAASAALRPRGVSCGSHSVQWRQASRLVLYRLGTYRSFLWIMLTLWLLPVLAFAIEPHFGVLGTFPLPLHLHFVMRKEAYVAYISQYPVCWRRNLPYCSFLYFFLVLLTFFYSSRRMIST